MASEFIDGGAQDSGSGRHEKGPNSCTFSSCFRAAPGERRGHFRPSERRASKASRRLIDRIREALGIREQAYVGVPSSCVWGDQEFQTAVFRCGASIFSEVVAVDEDVDSDVQRVVVLRCDLEGSLSVLLGALEQRGVPAVCLDFERDVSDEAYFAPLEWAAIMGSMEALNDGRSLRRPGPR